jgi:hypothetical protein
MVVKTSKVAIHDICILLPGGAHMLTGGGHLWLLMSMIIRT